jgi:hypothetical protein
MKAEAVRRPAASQDAELFLNRGIGRQGMRIAFAAGTSKRRRASGSALTVTVR